MRLSIFACIIPLSLLITAPVAHAGMAGFAPHRAIYAMKMTSTKNGSSIADVEGKMFFEWADACDAWTIDQKLQLKFFYAQGETMERLSSFSTWEAKDGKSYRFATRSLSNGEETSNIRGKATIDAEGGEVQYSVPSDLDSMKLPAGTLFPSAHTFQLLQAAEQGDKFFTRNIFDGSDEEGLVSASVFIAPKVADTAALMTGKKLKANALSKVVSWPVRLAFFSPDSETGEPDYEMNMQLLANGIASSMLIDYGDFILSGTLTELESLPRPGC